MVEKRGRLLVLAMVFLVVIVFNSYFIIAPGCCYGELVTDDATVSGCLDVDSQAQCNACRNSNDPTCSDYETNHPEAGTEFAEYEEGACSSSGGKCEIVCCCTSYPAAAYEELPRFKCETKGNTWTEKEIIGDQSCDTICETKQSCLYTTCEFANTAQYLTPGCYCKDKQLSDQNPFCCENDPDEVYIYSSQEQCHIDCLPVYNYILVGYVLVDDDTNENHKIGIKDASVYLDNDINVKTDDNGKFVFSSLKSMKTYELRAVKSGYEQVEARIIAQITKDTPENVEFNDINISVVLIAGEEETDCDNDIDDDNDGYIDQCDVDCNNIKNIVSMKDETVIADIEAGLTCDDDIDNDCDTFIDCEDEDCKGIGDCAPESNCGNSIREFGEECDAEYGANGVKNNGDDYLCPDKCIMTGDDACTCPLECGNGYLQGTEQCDALYNADDILIQGNDAACVKTKCVTLNAAAIHNTQYPNDPIKACKCEPIKVTCGDGIRQSNEECDGNDLGPDCSTDDACYPKDHPNECTCKESFKCGNEVIDPGEECDPGHDLDNNNAQCNELKGTDDRYTGMCYHRNHDFKCRCELTCQRVIYPGEKGVNLLLSVAPKQKPVQLNWEFQDLVPLQGDSEYCEPDSSTIYRCDATLEASDEDSYDDMVDAAKSHCSMDDDDKWNAISPDLTVSNYEDMNVREQHVYCYKINSYFSHTDFDIEGGYRNPDNNNEIEPVCVVVGNKECFEYFDEFCMDNDLGERIYKVKCDSRTNFIDWDTKIDCSALSSTEKYVCLGPDNKNKARCAYQSPCYECADPFGMFYMDDNIVSVYGVDDQDKPIIPPQEKTCESLDTCYFDYSESVVDIYRECSTVKTCYDYRSENACVGDRGDKCVVGGKQGCEWKDSENLEFGIGVCRPKEKILQDCERCNSPFNEFFGRCNANLCSLFGNDKCFYTTESDLESEWKCVNKEDVGCEDYGKNRNFCINSNDKNQNFTINITYVDEVERIAGGHNIIVLEDKDNSLSLSDDILGLGRCKWLELSGKCIKDANGDNLDDCEGLKQDASITYEECKKDFVPPETIFPNVDMLPASSGIKISAIDYFSKQSKIKTKYSVYKETDDHVYPVTIATGLINLKQKESDFYDIAYYSEDEAGNLEQVQIKKHVYLDATKPGILIIYDYVSREKPIGDKTEWESDLKIQISGQDFEGEDKIIKCTTSLNYFDVDENDLGEDGTGVVEKKQVTAVGGDLNDKKVGRHDNPTELSYINLKNRLYIFEYKCYDEAKNFVIGVLNNISIDADKSITNIRPSGETIRLPDNRKKEFLLDTKKDALCKYDNVIHNSDNQRDNFNRMTSSFTPTTTPGKKHTVVHTFDPAGSSVYDMFYVNLYVKCLFAEEDKVYGDEQSDLISFVVDNEPPVTTIKNFEDRWYPLKQGEDIDVNLECKDPIASFNPGTEFGCKEILYCDTGKDCIPDEICGESGDSCTKTYDKFTYLNFRSKDVGGNLEEIRKFEVKITKDEPKVNVTIIDILTGKVAERVTRLGPPSYLLVINSSKELTRTPNGISLFKYRFQGVDYDLGYPVPDKKIGGGYDLKTWKTFLTLSPLQHGNKEGPAEFIIEYKDNEDNDGHLIEIGKSFFIDTKPPIKPVLEPFEDDYHDTYYSTLKRIDTYDYVTNKPALFLTGRTSPDDQLLDVVFYLGHSEEQYNRQQFYQEQDNRLFYVDVDDEAGDNGGNGDDVGNGDDDNNVGADMGAGDEDDKELLKLVTTTPHDVGVQILNVKQIELSLDPDKYTNLRGRIDYGHYNKLYKITGKEDQTTETLDYSIINLNKKLQKDLGKDYEASVYEKEILRNWFYPEINFNRGDNYMKLRSVESFFVKSDFTDTYNILYDSVAPEIVSAYYVADNHKYPLIGSTINIRDAQIFFEVKELKKGSGFDFDNYYLGLNTGVDLDTNLNCENCFRNGPRDDPGKFYKNFDIKYFRFNKNQYLPSNALLNISLYDKAGSNLMQQFIIDYSASYPSAPSSLEVEGANCYDFTCFKKSVPSEIKVNFEHEVEEFNAKYFEHDFSSSSTNQKLYTVGTGVLDDADENDQIILFEPDDKDILDGKGKSDHLKFRYSEQDNLYSKKIGLRLSNFHAFKYYKIYVDDVYLMKRMADKAGVIWFNYDMLGDNIVVEIMPFDEKVYPIKINAKYPGEPLSGEWLYTLVVDSDEPNIIINGDTENGIKVGAGIDILINASVFNENFDVNATIVIGKYEYDIENPNYDSDAEDDDENSQEEVEVVVEKQVHDLLQASNTEYLFKYSVPSNVPHGKKIPYKIVMVDRAGNKKTINSFIEVDNTRPGVTITDVDPNVDSDAESSSGGSRIKRIVNGEQIFYVRNIGNKVKIKGSVEATQELKYLLGTYKKDIPLTDGNFDFVYNLISIDGLEHENVLIFELKKNENEEPVYDQLKIVADKKPPTLIGIEFEDTESEEDAIAEVKTPIPIIEIEYDEPAILIDYEIISKKEDNDFKINKEEFIVEEIDDNKLKFILKPNKPMPNDEYIFKIKAEDDLGNKQDESNEKEFKLNAPDTIIKLVQPKHQVATSANFKLMIETTKLARCRYSKENPLRNGRYNFGDLINQFKPDEDELVNTIHEANIGIIGGGVKNTLHVLCNDSISLVPIHRKFSDLRVDGKSPKITSINLSRKIISYRPSQTEMSVETDEKAVCKYGQEKDYETMVWFTNENDEQVVNYNMQHKHMIMNIPPLEKSYTYYIKCEDLAGLKTETKQVQFEVKKQGLTVEVLKPKKVSSKTKPNFVLETNLRAQCRYKDNKDENALLSLPMSRQDNTIHTERNFNSFEPGHYSYLFYCIAVEPIGILTQAQSEKEIIYNFTIDDTEPFLSKLNVSNEQLCPDDNDKFSITAHVDAYDLESGILGYNYSLYDVKNQRIKDFGIKFTTSRQIIMSGLKLNKTFAPYKISVQPINLAGIITGEKSKKINYSEKLYILDTNTPECQNDKIGPTINVKKAVNPRGVQVFLNCHDENGCDTNTFNFGTGVSKEECSPTTTYDSENGVMVTADTYVCWLVKDQLGNPTQGTQSVAFKDTDEDGVVDDIDLKCPETPRGQKVILEGDSIGCSEDELKTDSDGDGVFDDEDLCEDTPEGEEVETSGNHMGCSEEQAKYLDDDEDGIINMNDACPDTPYGKDVNMSGCYVPEIPRPGPFNFWPWIIGFLVLGILCGGGYYTYKKYPGKFNDLLGSMGLNLGKGKKSPTKKFRIFRPGTKHTKHVKRELPKNYIEKQLALKRRSRLKQKQRQIRSLTKNLFSVFSTKPDIPKDVAAKSLGNVKRAPNVFNKLHNLLHKKSFFAKDERKSLIDDKIKEKSKEVSEKQVKKVEKLSLPVKGDVFKKLEKQVRVKSGEKVFDELSRLSVDKLKPKAKIKDYLVRGISKFNKKGKIRNSDVIDFLRSVPKGKVSSELSESIIDYLHKKGKLKKQNIKEILLELDNQGLVTKDNVSNILSRFNLK